MPTIQEFYQQLVELYKKIESIYAECQTAKIKYEQVEETEESYNKYYEDLSDIVERNSQFITELDIDPKVNLLPSARSLSRQDKKILNLKVKELRFKIHQKGSCLKGLHWLVGKDIASFKKNILSGGDWGTTKILNVLPHRLAERFADNLFNNMISECEIDQDFKGMLLWAGSNLDESSSFWDKLSEHLGKKGWVVYKKSNFPMAEQNGPTCFFTSCAMVYAHTHQIPADLFPFYPSHPADPTTSVMITPVMEEFNLNTLRSYSYGFTESVVGMKLLEQETLRQDIDSARVYGLEPIIVRSEHYSKYKYEVIVDRLKEKGPIVFGYRDSETSAHAVVITGYATNEKGDQRYILFTDPNEPGRTCIEPDSFLDNGQYSYVLPYEDYHGYIRLRAYTPGKRKQTFNQPLIPNPVYNPDWLPGLNINLTSYYGIDEIVLDEPQIKNYSSWMVKHYHDFYACHHGQHTYKASAAYRYLYAVVIARAINIVSRKKGYNAIEFARSLVADIEESIKSNYRIDSPFRSDPVNDLRRDFRGWLFYKLGNQHGYDSEIRKNLYDLEYKELIRRYCGLALRFYIQKLIGKRQYDADPIFDLRLRLVFEAMFKDNYEKVLQINRLSSEELVKQYFDRVLEFYPKLKDVPPPTQEVVDKLGSDKDSKNLSLERSKRKKKKESGGNSAEEDVARLLETVDPETGERRSLLDPTIQETPNQEGDNSQPENDLHRYTTHFPGRLDDFEVEMSSRKLDFVSILATCPAKFRQERSGDLEHIPGNNTISNLEISSRSRVGKTDLSSDFIRARSSNLPGKRLGLWENVTFINKTPAKQQHSIIVVQNSSKPITQQSTQTALLIPSRNWVNLSPRSSVHQSSIVKNTPLVFSNTIIPQGNSCDFYSNRLMIRSGHVEKQPYKRPLTQYHSFTHEGSKLPSGKSIGSVIGQTKTYSPARTQKLYARTFNSNAGGAEFVTAIVVHYVARMAGAMPQDAEDTAIAASYMTAATFAWANITSWSTVGAVASTSAASTAEVAAPVIAITAMCGLILLDHAYQMQNYWHNKTYVPKDYFGKDNILFAKLKKDVSKALYPFFEGDGLTSSKNKKSKDLWNVTSQDQNMVLMGKR